MFSETDKAAILASAPKSILFAGKTYRATIEYTGPEADNVTDLLETNDIAVTFRYYGDHKDRETSPSNLLMAVDTSGTDISYNLGEKRQISLSINVWMPRQDKVRADQIIDAYITLLQLWSINELADLMDVVDTGNVSDLSYLENGLERRQMDITFRYQQGYTKTIGTIETVKHDLTLL